MIIPWNLILHYRLGPKANSQTVYDALFEAALSYKFRNIGSFAVRIDAKILTESIFNLNSHDTVRIDEKEINGQKLKELFITTIFLKHLETKHPREAVFFIALPQREDSCDIGVMVVEPDVKFSIIHKTQVKLPEKHTKYLFQIKEYFDSRTLDHDDFLTLKKVDIEKLDNTAEKYSEIVLFFLRDFFSYKSDDFKTFFQNHSHCALISIPEDLEYTPKDSKKESQMIKMDKNKHNYIINFSNDTSSIVSFNPPKCLLNIQQLTRR